MINHFKLQLPIVFFRCFVNDYLYAISYFYDLFLLRFFLSFIVRDSNVRIFM